MINVEKNIVSYLEDHRYMTLATVSPEGAPMAATVSYANYGTTIYFSTGRTTNKYKNITANPDVALTVDEDYDNWGDIKGVQLLGQARLLRDEMEVERAQKALSCKFPQFGHMPDNIDYAFFEIKPMLAYYLENSKGFGHRDKIVF